MLLDVLRLALVRERHHRQARQVHEGQVRHIGRVDAQVYRLVAHALARSGEGDRLGFDFLANLRNLAGGRVRRRHVDEAYQDPLPTGVGAKLRAHAVRGVAGGVDELEMQRAPGHHGLAEGQEVAGHNCVEETRLAAGLRAHHDHLRQLWKAEIVASALLQEPAERVCHAQHFSGAQRRQGGRLMARALAHVVHEGRSCG